LNVAYRIPHFRQIEQKQRFYRQLRKDRLLTGGDTQKSTFMETIRRRREKPGRRIKAETRFVPVFS